MGKATNFAASMNWNYSPDFKTILIDTKRYGEMDANDIVGDEDPETYLEDVESSPLILADKQIQQSVMKAAGIDGTQVQLWHLRLRKSSHSKDGTPVTELPDIKIGDWVIIGSKVYPVKWADTTHPFSFGDILLIYVVEDMA